MGSRIVILIITLIGGFATFAACLHSGAPLLIAAFLSIFGFGFAFVFSTIIAAVFRSFFPASKPIASDGSVGGKQNERNAPRPNKANGMKPQPMRIKVPKD